MTEMTDRILRRAGRESLMRYPILHVIVIVERDITPHL
jgi:hypothetical protein